MDELLKNTNDMTSRIGKMVGAILALTVFLSVSACATVTSNKELKPIDKVTVGIEDKEMRELWIQADNEGRLPPIEQIPIPDKRVTHRHVTPVGGIDIPKPVRPLIPEKVIADIQPFSLKTLIQYKGDFQIVANKPGVLIGKISDFNNPLELHYKLPVKNNTVHLQRNSTLQLIFRDDVQDSALQRRIVLSDKGKIAPFVYISEGSNEPYIEIIKEIGLKIEQEKEIGNPPIRVTYKDNVVVVKQGERRKIGNDDGGVEIYLRSSVAVDQKEQVLREGQPFYVNLVIYQAD